MKKINREIYQEAKYGRKALMITSIILIVLSLGVLAGGIALLVLGCISNETSQIVVKVPIGVVLILLGLTGGGFSIPMLFVSLSMIKTNSGSVKDGNRAIGTVNILKCDKCGRELAENSTFCTNCGKEVNGKIICECKTVNDADAEYCAGCGKKLK